MITINYVFAILGYKVHNESYYIKTYHNHKSDFRTYDKDIVGNKPWLRVQTVVHEHHPNWVAPNKNWWRFNIGEENNQLRKYISEKYLIIQFLYYQELQVLKIILQS